MTAFHIVCHGCDFEGVVDAEFVARALRADHADEHHHDVEYAEVEDPR